MCVWIVQCGPCACTAFKGGEGSKCTRVGRARRRLEGLWFVLAKIAGRLSGGGKVSGGKGC